MPTATTDTTGVLDTPFALPGGATIKNRLVMRVISATFAPLPPKRSRISRDPSAKS